VLFREAVLHGSSSYAAVEPFWELDSNLILPRMVNSILSKHSSVPCYFVDEPPYRYGEPHYRQEDIESIKGFDAARTFEAFSASQALIISQRFYQHCLKNKIPLEGRPVRIVPG
jgi:hypothetical protein